MYKTYIMDTLIQILKKLRKTKNQVDTYAELEECHFAEDIELAFYITETKQFSSQELVLKNQRVAQNSFRKRIIERDKKCIVSGANKSICEACHIIPYCDSDNANIYNINNGLLLNRNIHKLFDDHLVMIDPDTCEFIVTSEILNEPDYECINIYHKKYIDGLTPEIIANLRQREYLYMK